MYRESRMHKDYLEVALERCYEGYRGGLEAIDLVGETLEKWEQMLAEPQEGRSQAGAAQTFRPARPSPIVLQILQFKKVLHDCASLKVLRCLLLSAAGISPALRAPCKYKYFQHGKGEKRVQDEGMCTAVLKTRDT